MKKYIYSIVAGALALSAVSCSDFLDRAPQDALSPATFWQSESDAKLALVGCYNGLNRIYHNGHWTENNAIMMDALSDNYFDYFSWEGYSVMTTGNMTPSNTGMSSSLWSFSEIRACNEFLEMEENVAWPDAATENQYVAEVKTLRALLYFNMTQFFGDVPLIENTLATPGDAYLARDPKEQVQAFVEKELTAAIPSLPNRMESEQGRVNKQFAQGLLMRYYLYVQDYAKAETLAKDIINNGGLKLSDSYNDMFLVGNQYDDETIFDFSLVANTSRETYGDPLVPNGAYGGWSSVVPTVNLLEAFECIDGKPITESPLYDPTRPYENRDPRLRTSIIYSGQQHSGYASGYYNSMPQFFADGSKNMDWITNADNATKTGLNIGKYFMCQNISAPSHMTVHFKVMRLAEVILSLAECYIEQNKNLSEAAALINQVKARAYNGNVYGVAAPQIAVTDQATMREELRRERRVELNGEALRRFDLKRWGIMAETFRNLYISHYDGDLSDEINAYGDKVAICTGITEDFGFDRKNYQSFKDYQVWCPIPQGQIDVNPNLKQTAGY